MSNNNDKKRWGRRLGCTAGWAVLLVSAYYVVLFTGKDILWFTEFAKYMTFGLGFLVGGLTITDTILKK